MSESSGAPLRGDEIETAFQEAARLHRAGQFEAAEQLYAQVLVSDHDHVQAAHNMGALFLQTKRAAQALPLLASAASRAQGQPQNWITYIHALVENGQFDNADRVLTSCRALGLAGPNVDALGARLHLAWGHALSAERRYPEAEAQYRRAVEVTPNAGDGHAALGLVLTLQGRPADAEAAYRRAVEIAPQDFISLGNLASTLKQLNRHREAEAFYRRALEINPNHAATLRNLGAVLKDASRLTEAKASYLAASKLDDALEPAVQAHLALSPIATSQDDIAQWRAGFAEGLETFRADPRTFGYDGGKNNCSWYYLAYHGRDDRPLLEATAGAFAEKVAGVGYVSPQVAAWRPPAEAGRRIRVAFVSEFLHVHTIGRLFKGLIENLDRSRFEVVVVHGSYSKRDPVRDAIDAAVEASVVLSAAPEAQRAQIEQLQPDVLFFPDIGMSAQTYFLAHARLAPVQATSWGHPNTTGLKTIDYFLSSAQVEPAGAAEAYTERLIALGRLPCFYPAPPPAEIPPREKLGLPSRGTLYGCPQTLFKFHPQFDAVLAQIAAGDPDGHIILLEAQNALWTEALKARWAASHPILLDRVRFLPPLPHEGFMAHLAHIDVLLDPLHFGSGNTLYEAMSFGTPIVTWPGGFARGRIVQGAYRQMGVADAPVAERIEDYAPLALALGRDAERRAHLREALRGAARRELYEDTRAVREFETFLTAAVDAAGRGERLATWNGAA